MPRSGNRPKPLRELIADASAGPPFDKTFLDALRADPRVGAQKLFKQCARDEAAYSASQAHADLMQRFEREARDAGHARVAGIDEAGRGPLAGPIVAAAVVLGEAPPRGLDDSKRLTEAQRDALFEELHDARHAIGVAVIASADIDAIGIQPANYKAMLDAAAALSPPPDFVLVDGFELPKCCWPQRRLIKGDRRSASIAAASIVAKVTRDRLMAEYDAQFPQYGFARNKGYGTKEHLEAIDRHGPCPIHRQSFALGTRHRQTALPDIL